ncbi:MAG: hypothetical protein ICV68_02800 [Pyrinomonadaceae bacterium]|nr:hypothetical protein [Pyrinomonadaceae bacterium]
MCPRLLSKTVVASVESYSAQRRPQTRRQQTGRRQRTRITRQASRRDYSKFSHASQAHRQQACDSCHKFPTPNWNKVRKESEAFEDVTDYPQHAACLSCHHEQFFSGARPAICTNCHTNPSPRDSTRHPFPNPREIFDKTPKGQTSFSEFQINFPHDKHMDLFGRVPSDSETNEVVSFLRASWRTSPAIQKKDSCSNCHQTYMPQGDSADEFVTQPPKDLAEDTFWLKKGAFKTTPTSHEACFTCHTTDSGLKPAQADCATCHKLPPTLAPRADFDQRLAEAMGIKDKTLLEKWRRREAGRFRHEWFSHAELACAACHDVTKMNTTDERTKKVSVVSCGSSAGCHIGEPDSALNEAVAKKKAEPKFVCTKCHVVFGREAVPASHQAAVLNIKPK